MDDPEIKCCWEDWSTYYPEYPYYFNKYLEENNVIARRYILYRYDLGISEINDQVFLRNEGNADETLFNSYRRKTDNTKSLY